MKTAVEIGNIGSPEEARSRDHFRCPCGNRLVLEDSSCNLPVPEVGRLADRHSMTRAENVIVALFLDYSRIVDMRNVTVLAKGGS